MSVPSSKIRNALRRLWWYSPARAAAKKRAKWGKTKFYLCEICRQPTFTPEVDHVIAVGPTPKTVAEWGPWISRLFVPENGLQVCCKPCHLKITNEQRRSAG